MKKLQSRFLSLPKRPAATNPIILGAGSALWAYWAMVTIVTVMIVGATYWLLTHTVTA
jgi:hypothetical protein